jgi:putative DNA primase/helicase
MTAAPLPPINFAALAQALLDQVETLLDEWLPGGRKVGPEYVCGSLQGGAGRSCSVNMKTGRWADFQTEDEGGDLISLYQAKEGIGSPGKAARQLANEYGLESVAGIVKGLAPGATPPPPRPPPPVKPARMAEPEPWETVRPVPSNAVAPPFKHPFRLAKDIGHTAHYRVGEDLHGYVVRFVTSEGGKDTLPYTWCTSKKDGGSQWKWRQWDEPRPLYLPSYNLPDGRTVILVEGEKKADALQLLLDDGAPGVYCVASWPGGCRAWKKADWSWVQGASVVLWPDCDAKRKPLTKAERDAEPDDDARAALQAAQPLLPAEKQPGMSAQLAIGAYLRGSHGCSVQLLPIPQPGEVPDGWDCGDAIADGWDFERVQTFFQSAFALPSDVAGDAPASLQAAATGGGGGGKKIDDPADAEDRGPGDAAPKRDIPWWLAPYWIETKNKAYWAVSRKLVISALRHDELLEGVLGLNELTNNVDARKPWPWPHGAAGPVKSATSLLLGQYLSDTFGLPSITMAALEEGITTVAQSNRFHPVREDLKRLKHDGKSRIDKWLIHALGESPSTLPPQLAEYLSLVGRFMLLGMVWRVMEPGCKFDYCAVLEGPGGLGKSTFVKTLASRPYFSDAHFDLQRGKEGQEQVQGVWLYELQELSSIGKAELNLIKAFISSEVDRYRPSYGRTVEAFARQCVMVGTTNEDRYLRDRTGNRRWWPVPVRHVINNPWLSAMREQLLAEAYALYLQGVPYTPTREQEARLFVPMQESRLEETAVQSELMNVLTRPATASESGSIVHGMADFVTNAQLCKALGVDAAKSSPSLVREVGSWMKHQGWTLGKKTINGQRVNGYLRPSRWPAEPDDATASEQEWTAGLASPAPAAPTLPPPPAEGNPYAQDDDDAPF